MKAICLVFLLFISVEVKAYTGNELLSDMHYDDYRETKYIFYIGGAIDSISTLNLFYEKIYNEKLICVPKEVTNGQLMDITKRFLENNPKIRHQGAYPLIIHAIRQAYPCLKKE